MFASNSGKRDPTYTSHEKTALQLCFYFGFASPLTLIPFLKNCFLPLSFLFFFAYFYPFTRNPQDVMPTFITLHTLPQNIRPCSKLASPGGVIIVKTSGNLLSSSLISRSCGKGPGSCRAELPQIQPPGFSEGAGPVQWRV